MAQVSLRHDPARQGQFAAMLAQRLHSAGFTVTAEAAASGARTLAAETGWLWRLDRLLYPASAATAPFPSSMAAAAAPDWIVDLAGREGGSAGAPLLRPLYDGRADEGSLLAALMAGRPPLISLQREDGRIVAEGRPALEAARGLAGALGAVQSRLATLIIAAMARPDARLPGDGGSGDEPVREAISGRLSCAARLLRRRGHEVIANRFRHAAHWRVGWRWNDGPGVLDTLSLAGPRWQVLPDPGDRFYADPFPVEWEGRYALLFEELNYADGKGILSALLFDADGRPGPVRPILEEPHHLSYPFVFPHDGRLWMIPETSQAREIALYACTDFPWRWEKHSVLVSDIEAADTTLIRHDAVWWMFAVTRPGDGGYSDTLEIFHAESPLGRWQPHDKNPVLIDGAWARPAGAMIHSATGLIRPVQDCSRIYGEAVNIAAITHLSRHEFKQEPVGRLAPGPHWPGNRLHTINRWGRLEVIDGAIPLPRISAFQGMAQRAFAPR